MSGQPRDQPGEVAVGLDPILVEEQDRAPEAAFGKPARRGRDRLVRRSGAARWTRGLDRRRRQRRQVEPPAARADGRDEAPRRMADDEEERARRRLLEHLEERIGGAGIHVVGRIDDGDPPAGLRRRSSRRRRPCGGFPEPSARSGSACSSRPTAARGRGGSDARGAATLRKAGWSAGSERSVAAATAATAGRDGRRRSGRSDRRASPCRCPSARRSARHGACGRSR